MSLEAESWARMGFRKEASPIELIINWLTFWGGLEPTKTILIPRRIRKRMGGIKRTVLIFREDFLSKKVSKNHYRKKLLPSQHPDLEFF
jgi:hypothetical protein